MKSKKMLFAFIILGLAIGFAAVSTILYINGNVIIRADEEDFINGIIFYDYSFPNEGDGSIDLANTTGRTITFSTKSFTSLGDTSVLEYKIKNNSNYNAKVTGINCYFVDSNTKDTESTKTADTNDYLAVIPAAGFYPITINSGETSDATTLTVKQKKSYIGTDTVDRIHLYYQCKLDAESVVE